MALNHQYYSLPPTLPASRHVCHRRVISITAANRFPTYSRGERIADGCIHLIGVTASIAGAAVLMMLSIGQLPASTVASVAVYSLGLVAVFCFSASYHLVAPSELKALLRRFDHAAIYVKIAATYTPFAVIKMGGLVGFALLGVVWAITALYCRYGISFMASPSLSQRYLAWICVRRIVLPLRRRR